MRILRMLTGSALLWAAFLMSHEIAYRIAFPNPNVRVHELSHTGHGWLGEATHYGVPAIAAILLTGLFSGSRRAANSFTQWKHFGMAAGASMLYIGIETLERILNALTTDHAFVMSSSTLLVGSAVSFIFGFIVSGLFYEFQSFISEQLFAFSTFTVQPESPKATVKAVFAGPARIEQLLLIAAPRRGPPAFSAIS